MRIVIMERDAELATSVRKAISEHGLSWIVTHVQAPESVDTITQADVLVGGRAYDPAWQAAMEALRERFPGAARVLLLSQTDDAIGLSLEVGAHRVLRKRSDPEAFLAVVEGILDVGEQLNDPVLADYVARIDHLPAPPSVYLQLVKLMSDGDVAIARIVEALSQDPAFVAQVLRLCNSAYFSNGREATDMHSAVTRLGLQTIRRLVLASEVFGRIPGLDGGERNALQDRSLRTSRVAGMLLPGPSYDLATTAGLLAEVGRLLPAPDADVELDQARAGAYLLGLWGLPMPIVEAVAFYKAPQQRRGTGFWVTGALHVASALVNGTPLDEDYLARVGVLDRLPRWRQMVDDDLAGELAG